jgi:hypothetical protein
LSDRTGYIREARAKYDSYDSEEWIRAGFDEHTGGYFVYHRNHQFDPTIGKYGIPRGDYEKNASEVLAVYGMSVVLTSEIAEEGHTVNDGWLNDIPFEIKGVEGKSNRIIRDKIFDASKQNAEIVALYFHDKDSFNRDFVLDGYKKYLTVSKIKRVKSVYCIVETHLYKI